MITAFFKEYTWEIIIGTVFIVPVILYLGGYFWTRGSMNAKSEFLNRELTNINKTEQEGD